jgi:DHA1 family quinolone resistance protein-like MFS transporter
MTRIERKNWREVFRFEVNPVIKTLTISDIFILSGFGLISPVFAVFLTDNIRGGSVEVAGLAAAIYLVTKALGQLPAAQIIDKIRGERDDFWAMVIGSLFTSLVPLLYLLAHTPESIYLIQFVYGLSQAFTFPSWLAIFTRHIDPKREGLEWGIYYAMTDLTGAAMAAIGGVVAEFFGFAPLFVVVSILSFIGSAWLLLIRGKMRKR